MTITPDLTTHYAVWNNGRWIYYASIDEAVKASEGGPVDIYTIDPVLSGTYQVQSSVVKTS